MPKGSVLDMLDFSRPEFAIVWPPELLVDELLAIENVPDPGLEKLR